MLNQTGLNRFLLKTRRIFIFDDEICSDTAKSVVQQLKYLWIKSKEPIYIYINCFGGYTDDEAAILDEMAYIQESGGIITTICQGKACSAAADILCLGSPGKRFATKGSTMMMHNASTPLENDKLASLKKTLSFYEWQQESINKRLAKACGKIGKQKYEKFCKDIEATVWLNPEEAKRFGLIDGIWTQEMENNINKVKK